MMLKKRFELTLAAANVVVVVLGFGLAMQLLNQFSQRELTAQATGILSFLAGQVQNSVAGVEADLIPALKRLMTQAATFDQQPAFLVTVPGQAPVIVYRDAAAAIVERQIAADDVDIIHAAPANAATDGRRFGKPERASGTVRTDLADGFVPIFGFAVGAAEVVVLTRSSYGRSLAERWSLAGVGIAVAVSAFIAMATFTMARRGVRLFESQLEHTNRELSTRNADLERVSGHRRQMVHILAHDIVNPIGNIDSALSLCDDDPAVMLELRSALSVSVQQVLGMVAVVRQLERLELDGGALDLEPVALQAAVAEAVATISPAAAAKGVTFVPTIDAVAVLAEPVALVVSVLCNLLTNAVKFSRRNGRIVITSEVHDATVIVHVEDWGIGMPPRLLERVFDLGAKTSRSGTEGEHGTGFGMPLVARFIELFGGHINIVSQETDGPAGELGHQGTRISVQLRPASPSVTGPGSEVTSPSRE